MTRRDLTTILCTLAKLTSGPSRCFPFWQELLACYVMNTKSDDMSGAKKCLPVLEDYYECLHHKKEVSQWRFGRDTLRGDTLFESWIRILTDGAIVE